MTRAQRSAKGYTRMEGAKRAASILLERKLGAILAVDIAVLD